uniref:Uncharacterized protein n=1 Tax=Panagrolaimus sp. ES5 TaxID=591445 RepID=A0AC34FTG4_9BILA
MANPSVSIDIEPPSTVYTTLPPPPAYSEVYQKSTPFPQINSTNCILPQRHGNLMGPSGLRPNLAASAATTRNNAATSK